MFAVIYMSVYEILIRCDQYVILSAEYQYRVESVSLNFQFSGSESE
jgi:hypothetical protein